MAWTEDYRSGYVGIYHDTDSEHLIYGITAMGIRAQSEVRKESSAGIIYPDTVSVDAVRPMATFTTLDLKDAFDHLGATGKCIDGGDTGYGLKLWAQQQSCAGVASGSVHRTYTIRNGVIAPRTLTVDHRGNASLVYEAYAAYDGSNDPVVMAASQAMGNYPASPVGRWTMQGMTLAGNAIEGKRNITIDWGVQVLQEGADSDVFDTVTSLTAEQPRVTIRGVKPSWFETDLVLEGAAAAHADTTIWLKRRNYAVGSTEHIKLTLAGQASWDQIIDANPDAPAVAALNIDLVYDGSNAPIVVTTGIAIT